MVLAAEKTSQVGLHMVVAFLVMYVTTGSLAYGGMAAILEPICNVLLLPLHEKGWKKIKHRIAKARILRQQKTGEVHYA